MKRIFFRIVHTQNNHINFRKSLTRLFQQLKTAETGHREIQQHNVRSKFFNQLQCLQAVASLADDLHSIDPLQERTNSCANERVIICQYHLDWFHLALPFRGRRRKISFWGIEDVYAAKYFLGTLELSRVSVLAKTSLQPF